jgi:hypothetical protein
VEVSSSANLQWFPKFDALLFGRFASLLVFCLADILIKLYVLFLTQKQSSFPGEMSQLRYISAAPGLGGVAETAFAPPQDAQMGGITETAGFAPPQHAQMAGFAAGFAPPMAGFAPQGIPPLPTPLPTPGWAGFAPPQPAQMAGFAPPQPALSAETAGIGTLRAAGPAGTVTSPPPAGTVTSPPPAGQQRNTDESQNPFDLLRQNGINISLNFNFGNMPPRA